MINKKFQKSELAITITCLAILLVYYGFILYINLSGNPSFYITDMYADMNYSVEVWKNKSIFPDGWVYGNQLYAIATPVFASLIFGIVGNVSLAMGIASSILTALTIFSFQWMLKPVLKKLNSRLIASVVFMSIMLICGDPYKSFEGWQLLFTMCSYYACYAINVFITIGCYLRIGKTDKKAGLIVFCVLSCLMSFGNGLQSIRQTVIMVCPLIALEFLRIVKRKLKKEKLFTQSTAFCIAVSLSNLAGLIFSKMVEVQQTTIYGHLRIIFRPKEFLKSFLHFLKIVGELFYTPKIILLVLLAVAVIAVIVVVAKKKLLLQTEEDRLCIFFLILSLLVVTVIDLFTTVDIRPRYYFLLIPLFAICFGYFYENLSTQKGKNCFLSLICGIFIMGFAFELCPLVTASYTSYDDICNYLQQNNIKTVYSEWNEGEKISIESNWEIGAGFWESPKRPFERVTYLCNPEIYDTPAEKTAYIFTGKWKADVAVRKAKEKGFDLKQVKYFEEQDIYVYICDEQLMKQFPESVPIQ